MNKVFYIVDYKNIDDLIEEIKKTILDNYEFLIIKNNGFWKEDYEIMNYYNKVNNLLGGMKPADKNKYNNNDQDEYWVDIEYKFNFRNIDLPPWKTNEQLMLHTDNTLSNNINYANITELVCIQPSDYSGETVIISNNKIIELVKYLDEKNNTKLYNDLLNTKIYHKDIEKKICSKKKDIYTFNFNIKQILKSNLNTNNALDLAKQFSTILENIMKSSLGNIIKLEKGDALLLNDTLVMHGRKYVFGERLYKKCSILIN